MTCEAMLELMSAALDGELTADEKAQLDRHLAQCDHCRALFDELTAIHGACGQMEVEPPPALRARILEQLPPQETPTQKPSAKVIYLHWRRWAAMAAAFALISLAAWHLPQTRFRPAPSTNTIEGDAAQPQDSEEVQLQDAAAPAESETSIQFTSGGLDAPEDAAPTPAPTAAQINRDISVADADEAPQAKMAAPESDVDESETVFQGFSMPRLGGYGGHSASMTETGNEASAAPKAAEVYGSLRRFSSDLGSALPQDSSNDGAVTTDALDLPLAGETNGLLPEASAAAGGSAPLIASASADLLEPSPEPGMDETAPVAFAAPRSEEPSLLSYCGVVTLSTDALLNDYPAQIQENGEVWYQLPCAAFRALVDELTSGGASFDLRASGDDISASAELGLVVILP